MAARRRLTTAAPAAQRVSFVIMASDGSERHDHAKIRGKRHDHAASAMTPCGNVWLGVPIRPLFAHGVGTAGVTPIPTS